MTVTTAQIKAKGCKDTGLTAELARTFHDQLGKTTMAIVEIRSTDRGESIADKQHVKLEILSVEPAVDNIAEDHLRNLARALFMNRKLHSEDDQPTLDTSDDIEPNVTDVIAAQAALVHHDLVGDNPAACELCGNDALDPLHDTNPGDVEDYA